MNQSDIAKQLNIFLVGGAVRDELLSRKIVEKDYLVVGSTPAQMTSLGFTPVGKDFPVFLHPKTKEEYALARTERKQGQGYTGFVCYAAPDVTIEQDLMRRDLTVNAMAKDTTGNIIDPYNGQVDLKNRVLRHVSPAFSEDPLRVLRVARFAARYHEYGFTIAPETLQLMANIANSGELEALSKERIFKELERSLGEPTPEVFFNVLKEVDALKHIWPELDALWGVPNPAEHHPEICSGKHTMLVLQQAVKLSQDTSVRFAALCHDLGKAVTPESQWPKHYGHEKAGLALVDSTCERLKAPNHFRSLARKACEFHLHVHRAFELKPSTVLKVFNQLDIWRKFEEFELFLLVCEADAKGREGKESSPYPQSEYLLTLAKQCKGIIAKPFVEQGLKGKAIKEAIDDARLTTITQIKTNYPVKIDT